MQRPAQIDTYLLSCFYEGISKPRRLAEGLQRLAELLACQRASLRIWDRRGHWGSLIQAVEEAGQWRLSIDDSDQPQPLLRALVAKFEPGQWKRMERLPSGLPGDDDRHRSADVIPAGQTVFSTRLPLSQAEALLSLHRQGGDWPDMQSALVSATEACRVLLPALDPIVRIKQLRRQCAHLSAMLNTIRMPMLLLDAALRPLAANASASALFRLSARMATGRIAAALPGVAASQFRQLVERACSASPTGGAIEFAVSPESGGAHLLVLPLSLPEPGRPQPAALVLVQGEESLSDHAQRLLQHVYRLTAAEARLTQLILAGQSPGDAAASLRVSVSTVRTQLSSVLKKTGAQRQSDLVRRLSPLLLLNHVSRSA